MASKYRYLLTDKAEADLDGIVTYIAVQLANPRAASDFFDKLSAAIDEACLFPESGFPADNEFLAGRNIRKKTVGNYILYYLPKAEEKQIYILRVVYGKRNLDEIIRKMNFPSKP